MDPVSPRIVDAKIARFDAHDIARSLQNSSDLLRSLDLHGISQRDQVPFRLSNRHIAIQTDSEPTEVELRPLVERHNEAVKSRRKILQETDEILARTEEVMKKLVPEKESTAISRVRAVANRWIPCNLLHRIIIGAALNGSLGVIAMVSGGTSSPLTLLITGLFFAAIGALLVLTSIEQKAGVSTTTREPASHLTDGSMDVTERRKILQETGSILNKTEQLLRMHKLLK